MRSFIKHIHHWGPPSIFYRTATKLKQLVTSSAKRRVLEVSEQKRGACRWFRAPWTRLGSFYTACTLALLQGAQPRLPACVMWTLGPSHCWHADKASSAAVARTQLNSKAWPAQRCSELQNTAVIPQVSPLLLLHRTTSLWILLTLSCQTLSEEKEPETNEEVIEIKEPGQRCDNNKKTSELLAGVDDHLVQSIYK